MIRGYLIFEDVIGLVIKHDDDIMLAKVYAPVKLNICKLCADIKSAGVNAEWYCTFTESIVTAEKSIVQDIVGDKNVGILQCDFDVIKFILKECNIYSKVQFVPMLRLYASNIENAACLYTISGSIYAAVVNNGVVKAIDTIPYSNYNMYLSKLANVCEFEQVLNMENYPGAADGVEHLQTIVDWMDHAEYATLQEYENADLGTLDMDAGDTLREDLADALQYEDEEVLDFGREREVVQRIERPQRAERSKRVEIQQRPQRPKHEENFPFEDEVEERPRRPKRENVEERPRRPKREEVEERPRRPRREEQASEVDRPRRVQRPQRKESKAVKHRSNAMFVFLGILFIASAAFNGGARIILQAATEKTSENIATLNTASEELQAEISNNEEINELLASYDTIATKLS